MRAAALYDIHGNLPALRAVLAEVNRAKVDLVVFGGDVASGPLPAETVQTLMDLELPAHCVRGNADREVVEAFDAARDVAPGQADDPPAGEDPSARAAAFAASRISREQRDFLAAFAATVAFEVHGIGAALFCHGSPRSDTDLLTRATRADRLRGILAGVSQDTVVCGHTHQQFDRRVGRWRVVNAGSVGVPYEGRPGAYWLLMGPGIELRRTEYDLEEALAELRAGGFPDTDEMLRESLLEPADPEEVTAFFEDLAKR